MQTRDLLPTSGAAAAMRCRSKRVLPRAVMPTAAQAVWRRNWRRVVPGISLILISLLISFTGHLLLLHHGFGSQGGEPEQREHALVGLTGKVGIGEGGAQDGARRVGHGAGEEQQVDAVEEGLVARHLRRLERRQVEGQRSGGPAAAEEGAVDVGGADDGRLGGDLKLRRDEEIGRAACREKGW